MWFEGFQQGTIAAAAGKGGGGSANACFLRGCDCLGVEVAVARDGVKKEGGNKGCGVAAIWSSVTTV